MFQACDIKAIISNFPGIDTGAQCNVIPLTLDKEAAKDKIITLERTQITTYGEATLLVMAQVCIGFECGNHHYILECKLVSSTNIRPLFEETLV